MNTLTIEGELEIEKGLYLLGFDAEGNPIRYKKSTNRLFIKYNEDFDFNYYAIGKLIYLINLPNGSVIPIVSRNFSFAGFNNFKSQFLQQI